MRKMWICDEHLENALGNMKFSGLAKLIFATKPPRMQRS